MWGLQAGSASDGLWAGLQPLVIPPSPGCGDLEKARVPCTYLQPWAVAPFSPVSAFSRLSLTQAGLRACVCM